MTQDPNVGGFAPTPTANQPMDMQGNPVASTPARTFGPIQAQSQQQPQAPQQAPAGGGDTNALLQQLLTQLAAQAQAGQASTPGVPQAPVERSPEDQRLITALAGIHTSARDTSITKRTTIGGGLYFVKYSYAPATGVPATAHALVFDDGVAAHVFGGL